MNLSKSNIGEFLRFDPLDNKNTKTHGIENRSPFSVSKSNFNQTITEA